MITNWDYKFYEDEYNENGKRNRKNTDRYNFNCGGYALGIYAWFMPCEEEDQEMFDLYCNDEFDEDGDYDSLQKLLNKVAEQSSEWMVNNVPNLRRVSSPDAELNEDEWLVGFKFGEGCGDGDFHYIKRTKSGQFWHKPGAQKTRRMSKKEALSQEWCDGKYTSDTIWFAKRK